MLGESDRTFLLDRVTGANRTQIVVNGAAESAGLLADSLTNQLPLADAPRVHDVQEFNDLMAEQYVPAFEALATRVDAVAVVEPTRARVYAGDRRSVSALGFRVVQQGLTLAPRMPEPPGPQRLLSSLPTAGTMDDRTGRFDHLFAGPVRERIGESAYGSWRSIDDPDAVSLSFGFPFPDALPAEELAAVTEATLDEEGPAALSYVGGDYAAALTDVVVERAVERGIDCEPDEVLLTNGATHGLDSVCRTFLDPGDSMIVEAPTFMGALSLFRNFGVEIEGVGVDEDGMDVDALAEELAQRREGGRKEEKAGERGEREVTEDSAADLPPLVYTIPNFQNPTGTTLSLERRERLLELAEEYDFLILEDDAYGDLRYSGDPVPSLAALDDAGRVIRVGTFSKTIAPGIRTGWVIADAELMAQIEGVTAGGTNNFTRSVVGNYAASGMLAENVAWLRGEYEERRDRMLAALEEHMPEGATWTEPDGGFFVWVELPSGIDTDELLPDAADEGVVYLPGELFYPDDRESNGLRISFSHVSHEAIDEGIQALAKATEEAMSE